MQLALNFVQKVSLLCFLVPPFPSSLLGVGGVGGGRGVKYKKMDMDLLKFF